MPKRPRLPIMAWCSRKPAAFFTTVPPLRTDGAASVDDPRPNEKVADAAITQTAGSVESRGDRAANRRACIHERRIERQVLSVRQQPTLDVGERSARECRERALLRRVLDDARERRKPDDVVRRRREPGLCAGSQHADMRLGEHGRAQRVHRLRKNGHDREMMPARSSGCRP